MPVSVMTDECVASLWYNNNVINVLIQLSLFIFLALVLYIIGKTETSLYGNTSVKFRSRICSDRLRRLKGRL